MSQEKYRNSSLFPSELDIDADGNLADLTSGSSTKRSIGAILVDAGILTMEQALQAIDLQREKKIRFGEAAIELGMISEGDIRYALSYQYQYAYLPRSSGRHTNDELVAAYKPFGPEAEHLRDIRSQLKLRWFDSTGGRAMLAVVGAGRAEGGSYLAANLAIVFAQMGERTLVIDADMRAPRQHILFQLNNQLGFSSLLAGRAAVATTVQHIGYIPNLDVIPAGPTPPNPQELLNRDTLDELLEWAANTYDMVLIDTSSVSSGADAMIVAAKAGAAIAVARANETPIAAFQQMIAALKRSKIQVVGSVLNNPPLIDIGE